MSAGDGLRATRCLSALVAVALLAPLAGVRAADLTYAVFVDGRPVDRRGDSALLRGGTPYIDVVRAVRTFDGLLVFSGTALVVTIAGHVLRCTVGERAALLDGSSVQLPGAPFVRTGDTYVPLATIADLASARLTLDARRRRAKLSLPNS